MSASQKSVPFLTHGEARSAGWFSRRHQTNEAHLAAQDRREAGSNRFEAAKHNPPAESANPFKKMRGTYRRSGPRPKKS